MRKIDAIVKIIRSYSHPPLAVHYVLFHLKMWNDLDPTIEPMITRAANWGRMPRINPVRPMPRR